VHLRTQICAWWASFFKSICFFVLIVLNKSDGSNFRVLFSNKELSAKPLFSSVFVNVDWNFAVIVVKILFLLLWVWLLIFLLLRFFGRGVSCVKKQSQVVISVLSNQLNHSSRVANVPTVVIKEVYVFIDRGFILTLILDFLIKLFLKRVLDTGKCEEWGGVKC
jgi:hypothetical protein